LREVKESASSYGVSIARADVKDLVFPGNLQEIMNRVLAAERVSQAQLVESRTKAEVQKIEAQAQADTQRLQAQTENELALMKARTSAEAAGLAVQAETQALEERQKSAAAYATHPSLLRLEELKTLRELARNANARLYVDFKEKPGANGKED
jgi:regulator of protease activity HflC (stomatin/prohibitin superfamily)